MTDLLTSLIRSVFPPRNTELALDSVNKETVKRLYAPGENHDCFYLSEYSHPIIQSAVVENKFYGNRRAGKFLANILSQSDYVSMSNTVFIPIPLGKNRYRERGYNQVRNILKHCPADIAINTKALTRQKETLAQSALNKTERMKNTRDAFSFDAKKLPEKYKTIILLDDVLTTGSTLNSARQTIKQKVGADTEVICLAIAH